MPSWWPSINSAEDLGAADAGLSENAAIEFATIEKPIAHPIGEVRQLLRVSLMNGLLDVADEVPAVLCINWGSGIGMGSTNLCYLPAPGFSTAIMIEPLMAHAMVCICSPSPDANFAACLRDNPALLDYPVSEDWCARYLTDLKQRWCRILGQARIVSD